jgi:hypothetical protein
MERTRCERVGEDFPETRGRKVKARIAAGGFGSVSAWLNCFRVAHDPDAMAEITRWSTFPVRRLLKLGVEAHLLDAIGLVSAKGICHHLLDFINRIANRREPLYGGD